eukprot:7073649-Heterocapsa_arctica.AAC.1
MVKRCKIWAGFAGKPREPVTKSTFWAYFGQRVQADLWLVEEEIAMILVDEFSRFGVSGSLNRTKTPAALINFNGILWFRHHGPMEQ